MGGGSRRTVEIAALRERARALAQEMEAAAAQIESRSSAGDSADLRELCADLLCAARILHRVGARYALDQRECGKCDHAWRREAEELADLGASMLRRIDAANAG